MQRCKAGTRNAELGMAEAIGLAQCAIVFLSIMAERWSAEMAGLYLTVCLFAQFVGSAVWASKKSPIACGAPSLMIMRPMTQMTLQRVIHITRALPNECSERHFRHHSVPRLLLIPNITLPFIVFFWSNPRASNAWLNHLLVRGGSPLVSAHWRHEA